MVGPAVGPDTTVQPFLRPAYTIGADIDRVTPTCVILSWELRPNTSVINGSRVATVKLWRIVLNVLTRTERVDDFELILAGSRSNITLGPFELGSAIRAEVHLQKFVTSDGRTLEGESSFEGRPDPTRIGMCSVELPSMYSLVPRPTPSVSILHTDQAIAYVLATSPGSPIFSRLVWEGG